MAELHRLSVAEYHRLIELGVLTEDDNVELIEGYLVQQKTPHGPPHDGTLHRALDCLTRFLPSGWDLRIRCAITLAESEPEPDLAVVREDPDGYLKRHPGAADVSLVIEVADSTLDGDRVDKGRVYARNGIPCYWILNVADHQVEVYTAPSDPTASPTYAQRQDYRAGDTVALVLDGNAVAQLPVRDLLP
jgi:Uma2 family endonuclease